MKRIVIGISGFPQSGKDTFAKYLKKSFTFDGKPVKIISFAEPIRKVVSALFPDLNPLVNKEEPLQYFGDLFNIHYSYRGMVNMIAKLFRDNVRDDWWVRLMEHHIDSTSEQVIIIPDLRFFVEHELLSKLKKEGCYITKIVIDRGENHKEPTDYINREWFHFLKFGQYDYMIANNKGLTELEFTANLLAARIKSYASGIQIYDEIGCSGQLFDLKKKD